MDNQIPKAFEDWMKAEQLQADNTNKLLESVKSNVTDGYYRNILTYIEDCDYTYNFQITETPPNNKHKQKETDYGELGFCWVDQYQNGGYTGDSFAGQVWIEIVEGSKWLTFYYNM